MKKLETMLLMLLIAFMGMTLQSCGSDNDDEDTKASYTLTAALTDKGNLPEEAVALIEPELKLMSQTFTATLAEAKAALDETMQLYKSTFAVEDGFHFTITFYLKDSAGKEKYSKRILVNGSNVTIQ